MTLKEYFNNSRVLMTIIGVNIGIYLLLLLFSLTGGENREAALQGKLVLSALPSSLLSRPWTLLTYMFTQVSFLHLLFNMLWLLWFGRIFLFCASQHRLLVAFIGGGLFGAGCYLAACSLSATGEGYLIGSSAAVLSVMTAASVMAPNLELRLFLLGGIRLKYVALLCILLTFLGIGGGNAGGFSAHFGGVIFGLMLPWLFGKMKFSSISTPFSRFRALSHKIRIRRRSIQGFEDFKNASSMRPKKPLSPLPSPEEDEVRLDELLEKVRISGYDSLSSSEKRELNAISSRL